MRHEQAAGRTRLLERTILIISLVLGLVVGLLIGLLRNAHNAADSMQ